MNKQPASKLRLARQTLRTLTPTALETVAGATLTISATLWSLRCPTSAGSHCTSEV